MGVVSGLMLLVGSLNSSDFTRGAFTDAVEDNWFWYLLVVLLAVVGMVAQGQAAIRMRRTVRQVWYDESV